jgi:ABC-2 type transport system permease protein
MTTDATFQPINARGWRLGFRQLFAKENHNWWRTRRWWNQLILWTALINGTVALMLFVLPNITGPDGQPAIPDEPLTMGLQALFTLGAMMISIGVVILTQDAIIGEKSAGTAEWVLSKPVSRKAFFLSKLSANLATLWVLLIGLQGLIGYGLLWLASPGAVNGVHFLFGVGLMSLHTFFYLTLTLTLGVFFADRGPILAVTLGSALGGKLIASFIKPLISITPWALPDLTPLVVSGEPLPVTTITSITISTALWCLVFIAASLWKIERLEF